MFHDQRNDDVWLSSSIQPDRGPLPRRVEQEVRSTGRGLNLVKTLSRPSPGQPSNRGCR
jgi:hypothetical protein